MIRKSRTVALLAVLSMAAVSCQQEPMLENPSSTIAVITQHSVMYGINGTFNSASFSTDEEWLDFVDFLFALAEEGNKIEIKKSNAEVCALATKEKVTYKTTKRDDAVSWFLQMESDGYTVTMEYDSKTGIYTCTAVK